MSKKEKIRVHVEIERENKRKLEDWKKNNRKAMKLFMVMFRGECKYASTLYADALSRANILRKWFDGEMVDIIEGMV